MCLLCYAFKSGQVIWAQKEPRISWSCCVISHLCWSFWPIPISITIWTEHEIMRYIVTMFYRPHQSYYTTGRSEQTGDARRRSRCSKKPEPEWWALRLVIIKLFPPKMDGSLKWGYPKMDSLQWNILLWWILWGYPYFRIPPKIGCFRSQNDDFMGISPSAIKFLSGFKPSNMMWPRFIGSIGTPLPSDRQDFVNFVKRGASLELWVAPFHSVGFTEAQF